jgi:7-cyano-7-deazaguanine synthase
MTEKILVLLSGGTDSATCLAHAVKEVGAENVETLNMTYGQRHNKEIVNAKALAIYYGVNYTLIDLTEVFNFSNCALLAHSTDEIKHESYTSQVQQLEGNEKINTYVPFRNGVMLSVCTTFALSKGCCKIYIGSHSSDHAYPDCTVEFDVAMRQAIYEGSGHKVDVAYPLMSLTKTGVIKQGLELGVPYELTWSCYEGKDKACGKCASCVDRMNAFKENGVEDPIEYEE